MSDITINYKGSAIATMDASGTKTLLTDGKYCEDDIEVVYVKPGGGGSSVLSGHFTPTENCYTLTISALAGTTLDHFFFKPTGDSTGPLGHSLRVVGPGFIDFTTNETCHFIVFTNTAGTSYNGFSRGATAGGTNFSLDRETGVLTTNNGNSSGALVAGVQYDWWAW